MKRSIVGSAGLICASLLVSCGGGGGGDGEEGGLVPVASRQVVVLAWNDLGMHCLNPTYDTAVILPPYNTVWAQVIRRGDPPQLVTAGVRVEYEILDNTTSQKTSSSPVPADFRQFWEYAQSLFGVNLAINTGLNLTDPDTHNGLSGQMVAKGDHFQVDGIPLTPVKDEGTWDPYQVAQITVRDASTGEVVAETMATVPTSDEIHCDKCHGPDPFADVLAKHDEDQPALALAQQTPVLCASCHASPALGTLDRVGDVPYLSEAIHTFHADVAAPPTCYDCHPGATTQCNRSLRHTAPDGNCTDTSCHGSLLEVGQSIARNERVPWLDEPKCAACHGGSTIPEVDTGALLYRNAAGHGGLACPACHGSPHAMVPSREVSDNYQAMQYQGAAVSLGSCGACHGSSKGEGLGEFNEEHGGASGRATACSVCHTAVSSTAVTRWPHSFKWTAR